jgi:outer membrane protein insertion porin family
MIEKPKSQIPNPKFGFLLFLFTFLLLPFLCYGQQEIEQLKLEPQQEGIIEDVISGQEAPVEEVRAAPQKTVTGVEVSGNKSISTNTIISKMKTKVGSVYLENIVSDDIKRLYLLGFFSDIKVETQDYKEGVKLVITVAERPIIESITFEGLRHLYMKEERLRELINFKSKEKQYLDYPTLKEDCLSLKKFYEKKGYSNAKVDYKVTVNSETNKASITIIAQEGTRVRIKKVVVDGNAHFSRSRILKLMKTRQAWLFNAGLLKDDVLAEDIERISSFYKKEGFADVKVEYSISRDPKKPYLFISIKIEEGKKYLVGDIKIQGNSAVKEQDIRTQLKESVAGEVFSEDGLKQDIASIQGIYFDRGYIFAQVDGVTSLNPATERVDILYTITENEIAHVDKIKIRGNIKTKDMVIRRELRIHPGDRFDGEKLRRSKERLQNLGFFEEVSYNTEPTETSNKKDLVVEVKEAKTGSFSFGGGYSTVDQFVGFIEVEQKNFDWKNFPYFTGDGQNLKLRASFGTVSDSYSLSFTEPWIFDYPISFGFDVYKMSHDRESDVGYGYDEDRVGGDIRFGKDISEYISAHVMYKFEQIDIGNIPDTATADLRKEEGKNSISSLECGLAYDSRDNIFNPTRGILLSGSVEGAGGPFGGDKDFIKCFGRASKYFPLFMGSSLEFRARVGLADPYGNSDYIPIYGRFFAGGADTIRGYEERKVGPIDAVTKDPLGGEALLIGNIEYTYPLMDFLKGAVFFDSGNVWEKMDDLGNGGFCSSFGFGARIKTPIGPIRLDYGIPLNKAPGEEKKSGGRFHFSVSHGF